MDGLTFDDLLSQYAEIPIEHAYDPQKAHDYYLRVRQLKGRQKGTIEPQGGSRPRGLSAVKQTPKNSSHADRAARVKQLKAKLDALEALLARLVKEAKRRSGGDANKHTTKTKTSTSSSKSGGGSKSAKGDSKLSPKEKAEAAKRSKDYYEKHKKDKKDEPPGIEEVRAKIKDVKEQIRKMREQLSNETASKGR